MAYVRHALLAQDMHATRSKREQLCQSRHLSLLLPARQPQEPTSPSRSLDFRGTQVLRKQAASKVMLDE